MLSPNACITCLTQSLPSTRPSVQMYYTVRDVRTSDDAHLTVHLMLFYELQSIDAMLDSTNDMRVHTCSGAGGGSEDTGQAC